MGQPRWTADGGLVFVDDRSGWWLPYRVPPGVLEDMMAGSAGPDAVPAPLVEIDAEFHGPDWVFGLHTFDELADGALAARMGTGGRDHLVVLRPPSGGPDAGRWSMTEVAQPCVSLAGVVSPDGISVVICGTTPTESHAVLAVAPDGATPPRRLSAAPAVVVTASGPPDSRPHRVTVGGHGVPGLFFPPANPDAVVEPGCPPPLVVFCHGGPTAAAEPGYDPNDPVPDQPGHRRCRRRLPGEHRVRPGLPGPAPRLLGRGRRRRLRRLRPVAGRRGMGRRQPHGHPWRQCRGPDRPGRAHPGPVFAGAVAWYGVTDLLALATDTHDFESRYLDRLVGPLPEAVDIYRERSPIHHAADLAGRVLLLQGADDPIVPLDQAERFAAELGSGGAAAELVVFEGESHGFRRAATIEACLDAELGFYRDLFAPSGAAGA